jgi:hypothetical protein
MTDKQPDQVTADSNGGQQRPRRARPRDERTGRFSKINTEPMVALFVRLRADTVARLKTIATERGVTLAAAVEALLSGRVGQPQGINFTNVPKERVKFRF